MSPDQYKNHPFIKRLISASTGFTQAFPYLAKYVTEHNADMRGLTMFQGDTNEWVIGLRSYDFDGQPTVCWSSGDDVLMAFINLDKCISDGKFYPDKKEIARQKKSGVPPGK